MKIRSNKKKESVVADNTIITEDYFADDYESESEGKIKSETPKAEEVDVDLGTMTFEEAVEKISTHNVQSVASQEVEDEDLGDVATSDELYHIKEEQKKVDNQVLDAVDSSMSAIKASMNDVILKQAQILEKNADSMQSMQENLTTVVKSQSEMVSSISRAIDKKFSQQDVYVSGLVEDKVDAVVYDAVAKPINEQNEKRRNKEKRKKFWGIIRLLIIGFLLSSLYFNESTRVRIGLVATDIKNIIVDIVNGKEVTGNKLIYDLGVKLNKINTVYYDEDGNEITEEEYYRSLYGSSSNTSDK